jgi:hypothetical protein
MDAAGFVFDGRETPGHGASIGSRARSASSLIQKVMEEWLREKGFAK